MKEKKEIKELRDDIDRIDTELVSLIKSRLNTVVKIGIIKQDQNLDIFDMSREEEVFRNLKEAWGDELPYEYITNIYREIIGISQAIQRPPRVAYLGPVASFTFEAALNRFSKYGEFFATGSINEVFDAVQRKEADFGVVPVENSTEGIVSHTLDMFMESELKITGEIFLRISFDLMSKTGKIEDVENVISHPHALAQTRRWLSHNLPKVMIVETKSTSDAALQASKDPKMAAVAGEEAGKKYELTAIRRDIGDRVENYTRFLVISENYPTATGDDKTTILFSVKDKPGILHDVLGPFSRYNINLTKIESRPSKRELWDYVFFLDMVGHIDDVTVKKAVERIKKFTTTIRFLGSYPRVKQGVKYG